MPCDSKKADGFGKNITLLKGFGFFEEKEERAFVGDKNRECVIHFGCSAWAHRLPPRPRTTPTEPVHETAR